MLKINGPSLGHSAKASRNCRTIQIQLCVTLRFAVEGDFFSSQYNSLYITYSVQFFLQVSYKEAKIGDRKIDIQSGAKLKLSFTYKQIVSYFSGLKF